MGTEATDAWGTAVAQSVKLMNIDSFDITPLVESAQVKDMRGSLAPGHQSIHNRTTATATMNGMLTVEQSPYWFNSLLQTVTPTVDTEATWNWAAPLTASPAISSYTIAKGNVNDAGSIKSLSGAIVRSLNISGAVNQPLAFTANFIGKSADTDTFDSDAEADVSTTILTGCDVAIYIDPSSDAAGTTAITNTGFDFSLDINSNRDVFNYLGSCTPGNWRDARFEGALTLGLELNTTSAAYLDAILTTSTAGIFERVVRIKATEGTDYLQIDFNGVALEAPQLFTDRDGITTINLVLNGQYNATLANWLKVEAFNTVTALS